MDTEKNIKANQEIDRDLTEVSDLKPKAKSKTYTYALLALVLGISTIILICSSKVVYSCYLILLIPLTGTSAVVLGLLALLDIQTSKGSTKSLIVVVAGIAIPTIWMATAIHFFVLPVMREVRQRTQLFSIDTSIELFNSEFDGYPPSDALDPVDKPYCGAMKLCEAMMGQDLMGFHPDSTFRSDGTDGVKQLYPDPSSVSSAAYRDSLSGRRNPYLTLEDFDAFRLGDLYENAGPFAPGHFVLCDRYKRVTHRKTGKKVGMPILYYKANTSKTAHDVNDPDNPENIYDYRDNHALLALGVPGKPGKKHPLFEDPRIFYEMTRDHKSGKLSRPNRADTYILLSAGQDGLYGTKDDIANFDMKWKRK